MDSRLRGNDIFRLWKNPEAIVDSIYSPERGGVNGPATYGGPFGAAFQAHSDSPMGFRN